MLHSALQVDHWVLNQIYHSQKMMFADLVIRQTPREVRETNSQQRIFQTKCICSLGGKGQQTLTCINPSKLGWEVRGVDAPQSNTQKQKSRYPSKKWKLESEEFWGHLASWKRISSSFIQPHCSAVPLWNNYCNSRGRNVCVYACAKVTQRLSGQIQRINKMDLMSALQFLKLQEISQGEFSHVIRKHVDIFLF